MDHFGAGVVRGAGLDVGKNIGNGTKEVLT
jgi:hypothetical protein